MIPRLHSLKAAPIGRRLFSDQALAALVGVLALLAYGLTLAPSIVERFDDSAEFPLVAWRLAIAHPTGYPLYTLLAALAARLLPIGDVAYRVNLLSALCAAGAVALSLLVARQLRVSRVGAVASALLLATAPTFWAQATVAEVYSLHLLLLAALLWTARRWASGAHATEALPWAPILVAGLGLAHHRMMALWLLPLGLFLLWQAPWLRRPGRAWAQLALIGAAPLLLYLYLPLRASVGSLDGSYTNTLSGFFCWISACQYSAFLTGDPLQQARPPLWWLALLREEVGILGLALALVGALWGREHRQGQAPAHPEPGLALIVVGGALSAAFALAYRVADPEVFWLPVVLVIALLAGIGVDALLGLLRGGTARRAPWRLVLIGAGVLLLMLFALRTPAPPRNVAALDRSRAWEVIDAGHDALSQPLPEGATIIGILGEMTVLRYLQETAGLRQDVVTVAADTEPARMAAVEQSLTSGQAVFLTRPLPEAGMRWSLSALGPLIEVVPTPRQAAPAGLWPRSEPVGAGLVLAGWTLGPVTSHLTPTQRLTVAWQVTAPITEPLKVSPRLRLPDGSEIQGQDSVPVRFAYPTTLWRPGEIVQDAYELPVHPTATTIIVIVYREADGSEVGRVEFPTKP